MYLGRIVEAAPARVLFARPTHPYTRILLAAAPRLTGRRATDHIAVRGDPPSAAAIHARCAFAARCPLVEPGRRRPARGGPAGHESSPRGRCPPAPPPHPRRLRFRRSLPAGGAGLPKHGAPA